MQKNVKKVSQKFSPKLINNIFQLVDIVEIEINPLKTKYDERHQFCQLITYYINQILKKYQWLTLTWIGYFITIT